ncbi:unnamed protein product [Closterium sp. NIES-53]
MRSLGTVQALYDALVARYSSPATAALGRLLLPYLFPELFAFTIVQDLVSHLRASDARYRAAVPAEILDTNPPPMDHFLSLDPTSLAVNLLEQHLLAAETSEVAVGAARGTPCQPFFEGCSPSPLAPSYASAAAADVSVPEDVGASSASAKRRSSKGKGGRGGGGSSGGGGCSGSGGGGSSGGGGGGGTVGGSGGSGGGGGGSGGSGGCGGGGNGGGGTGARRVRFVGVQHQHQQRQSETPSPQQLREWFVRGASGGSCPIAILDLDFDAILSTMYALSVSAECDCYRCVPPGLGIEAPALDASESSTLPCTAPAQALHTFTLDFGASCCFFRDSTTLTPLPAPVPVRLADPSGGLVMARSSTVLPCLAVRSGSLSGLHLPSFSTNLVSTAALQDAMVTTTCQRSTGDPRLILEKGYRLVVLGGYGRTDPPLNKPFYPNGLVVGILTCYQSEGLGFESQCVHYGHPSAGGCQRSTGDPPLILGKGYRLVVLGGYGRTDKPFCPNGVRVRSASCVLLVSPPVAPDSSMAPPPGSPLPALPSWHALSSSCLWSPQVSASPSAFACPTLPPLRRGAAARRSSLLLVSPEDCSPADSPACVSGQSRERYFLLVVEDYTLCPQLREYFGQDLPVLRLYSDRGGEFSSKLLRDFCRGEGILQSFTLPYTPQQNGIPECRISLVMEVAPTSMIHAAAPHFLWPFAVGDASVFRVWGSHAFVHDTSVDKLSPCAIPCVFLGFVPIAPGWQFYHPTSHRVFLSQDVTFDESVPFYHLFPYRSTPPPPLFLAPGLPPVDPLPPQGPTPSGVSQVDPLSGPTPVQVALDSGVARGAVSGGAEPGGAESEGDEVGGAKPGGVATGGAEPEGVEIVGAEPGGAEHGGAALEGSLSTSKGPQGQFTGRVI